MFFKWRFQKVKKSDAQSDQVREAVRKQTQTVRRVSDGLDEALRALASHKVKKDG